MIWTLDVSYLAKSWIDYSPSNIQLKKYKIFETALLFPETQSIMHTERFMKAMDDFYENIVS